jgi:Na+/phosphate symporter
LGLMKSDRLFVNPFTRMGLRPHTMGLRIEDLHGKPVSSSLSFEDGLPIMMAKILEMTRLLSRCLFSGSKAQMRACEGLAKEIHVLEKVLTRSVLSYGEHPELVKGLLRLPFRMERIGDMLESILNCCRVRAEQGVPISAKGCSELDQLFSVLLAMMAPLRDAFVSPEQELLEHVVSRTKDLRRMLREFRSAHWTRLAAGLCTPEGSSLYLDLFDSIKSINEYLQKIGITLLEMGLSVPAETDVGKKAKKKRGGHDAH